MKIFICMLLAVTGAFANVEREILDNDVVRLTFSGKDIAQFDFLKNSIDRSRSSIRGLCFTEMQRGDFGQPIEVKKCALLLDSNQNVSFYKLNRENPKESVLLQLREKALIQELAQNINATPVVASLKIRVRTRRCSTVNSNPQCSTVRILSQQESFKAKIQGDIENEAALVCSVEGKAQCFLTASHQTSGSQRVEIESPQCGLEVEGRYQQFFDPGETIVQDYRIRTQNRRPRLIEVASYDDSVENVYHQLSLKELRFFGPDILGGEINCSSIAVREGRVLRVSCTNTTDKKIDIHNFGARNPNGAVFKVQYCNFSK